jgi:transposase
MPKPYSNDLRTRVIELIEEGATRSETAEQHHVSLSSVGRFLRRKRETGSVSPAQFGGYKRHALAAHEERIRQWVSEQPDITLSEIAARLMKHKVKVGLSSIFRFLRHLHLTLKKKPARCRAGSAGRRRRARGVAQAAAAA